MESWEEGEKYQEGPSVGGFPEIKRKERAG